MAKLVRYNGGTQRYYSCTNPDNLVVGKDYTVVLSKDKGYQTNYVLLGEEGEFNSVWFETVKEEDRVEMGVAGHIPAVGESFEYSQLVIISDCVLTGPGWINRVEHVNYLGNSIYEVKGAEKLAYILVG